MPTNLILSKDINGNVDYGIPFTEDSYHFTMEAAGSQELDVPPGMTKAYIQISAGSTVICSPAEITAPTSTPAKTWGQQNVAIRDIRGVEKLYFYALQESLVTVSFYKE